MLFKFQQTLMEIISKDVASLAPRKQPKKTKFDERKLDFLSDQCN